MFQILVVEDDASLRKLMSAELKQHGYVTFLANDGLEALDVLEKTNIDLIIFRYNDAEYGRLRAYKTAQKG